MQLQAIKTISREDLGPNTPQWVEPLLSTLNLFMRNVVTVLDKNVDAANIRNQVKVFTLIGSATAADNNYSFSTTYQTTPIGAQIISIQRVDGVPEVFTAAPFMSWIYRNGQLQIIGITGLTAGVKYQIIVELTY